MILNFIMDIIYYQWHNQCEYNIDYNYRSKKIILLFMILNLMKRIIKKIV